MKFVCLPAAVALLVAVTSGGQLGVADVRLAAQATQGPLVPKPFPGSAPAKPADPAPAPPSSPTPGPPSTPAPPPATAPAPAPPSAAAPAAEIAPPSTPGAQGPAGLPVYPSAEFIDGFDAG